MDKEKLVKVQNRTFGKVCYCLPEIGVPHRSFMNGEEKELTVKEIEALSFLPGGMELLRDYLLIKDAEVADFIIGAREPEYDMTPDEIRELVLDGDLDEFEDFLNFAPQGSKELVKSIAVECECPDHRKRALIEKILGFNVNNAIAINEVDDTPVAEAPQRKSRKHVEKAAAEESVPVERKAPKYKVKGE